VCYGSPDDRTSIGNISIIFKGDPEEAIASSVSTFRRALIFSFIVLVILHKLGLFVSLTRALGKSLRKSHPNIKPHNTPIGPSTNSTIVIDGTQTGMTGTAAPVVPLTQVAHYGDKTDTFPKGEIS